VLGKEEGEGMLRRRDERREEERKQGEGRRRERTKAQY
jgi:hypothetical protein